MEFEERNNSGVPRIQRIKYKDYYIYIISYYDGCNCGYIACDSMYLVSVKLKVRLASKIYEDCKLVRTSDDRSYVRLDKKVDYTPIDVLDIALKNYEI
jgi:hypothetical protein